MPWDLPRRSSSWRFPRKPSQGCLVLDVEMPELNGLELQQRLNAANDNLPIVFITGYGNVPKSVAAFRQGAVDFLTKPFAPDTFLVALSRALERAPVRPARLGEASTYASTKRASIEGIVGQSPALEEVLRQVRTVAGTEATVLVQGETGTGKESVARALHEQSARRAGPFIKLNCAAIPGRAAGDGVDGTRKGSVHRRCLATHRRFELAHNGTIFLDEIGEMPLALQPKLLRLLQEREFERVWRRAHRALQRPRDRRDQSGFEGDGLGFARSAKTCTTDSA